MADAFLSLLVTRRHVDVLGMMIDKYMKTIRLFKATRAAPLHEALVH